MKKLFPFLLLFFPVIISAQIPQAFPVSQQEWRYLGTPGFSIDACYLMASAVSPAGQPYVAYIDDGGYQYLKVKKYDGTDWVNVGSGVVSPGAASAMSMAVSPSGEPYVAFCDVTGSYDFIKLMKFDGTNWIYVGGVQGYYSGPTDETKIAISPSGEPYIAYVNTSDDLGKVIKYSGGSFVQVGTSFSYSNAYYIDLKFNQDGTPWVSYSDTYHSQKISVMKYDGSDWVYVGLAGFSNNSCVGTSLAFNSAGEPYVAYYDTPDYQTYSLNVKKFSGSGWINVGGPISGVNNVFAEVCSIVFNSEGQLFVISNLGLSGPVLTYDGSTWVNVGTNTPPGAYLTLFVLTGGNLCAGFSDPAYQQRISVTYYGYPVGVEPHQKQTVRLYPSPVRTSLTVELPGVNNEIKDLEILTCSGSRVMEMTTSDDKVNLNLENFPAGIYVVKIRTGNMVYSEKVIKSDTKQ